MKRFVQHALVALAGAAVLAACGGYAGEEAPQPYPSPNLPGRSATTTPPNAAATETPTVPAPSVATSAPTSAPADGSPKPTCSLKSGVNELIVEVPPGIRAGLGTLRVQLLQGPQSRQVVFPIAPAAGKSTVATGVTVIREGYRISLGGDTRPAALAGAWQPRARATVIVEGRSRTDAVEYRRTQTFAFRLSYPNGKQCDKVPNFAFTTALRPRDRVGLG